MLPIFLQKGEGKQTISQRMKGWRKFEDLLKYAPKSVGILVKLNQAFTKMTESPLFKNIDKKIEGLDLDVRSQSDFVVLLFSTGKVAIQTKYIVNHWQLSTAEPT